MRPDRGAFEAQPKRETEAGEAFRRAVRHHLRGEWDQAERLYEQVAALDPAHGEARRWLGVLHNQQGRFQRAEALIRAAMDLGPATAAIWNDYGVALAGQGRREPAMAAYHEALALAPAHADALNNLGEALRADGRAAEALPLLERAASLRPGELEIRANLGHALAALDRDAEALAQYESVLADQPGHLAALRGRGLTLMRLDRCEEAVAPLRAAVAAAADQAQPLIELGRALARLDRHEEALDACRRALALAPERAEAHLGAGQALVQLARPVEALASLDAALAIEPELAEAHHSRGSALQTLGQGEAAFAAFQTAVALAPGRPGFHHNLAEARRFTPGDPRLAAMEALAQDLDGMEPEAQATLHYALFKAYDDLGRHGRAFRHLQAGAALKRASVDYDEAATFAMFRRIMQVFTAPMLQAQDGLGDPCDVPVFIVGMPRSGTTLMEQVLASHPQAFGAGELSHVRPMARAMAWEDGRRAFPDIAPGLSADALRKLGGDYLAKVRPLAPWAARITDKMPENFPFLGLIHLMLPNARIIAARRDPIDTCLSCYSKLFAGHQPHTYDLAELGRYYRAYDALMAHWRSVLPPGVLIEVQYEALVADFEPQARRMLAHCGLDWDERCRAFHRTERPVRTASAAQVRRPLYASSVGRGRPYRRLLAPLIEALGPAANSPSGGLSSHLP